MQLSINSIKFIKGYFQDAAAKMAEQLYNIILISPDARRPSPTFSFGSREVASAGAASHGSRGLSSAEIKIFSGFSNRETRKFPDTVPGFSLV
jgi:hypothetical protein